MRRRQGSATCRYNDKAAQLASAVDQAAWVADHIAATEFVFFSGDGILRFSLASMMQGFGSAKPLLAFSWLFLLLALLETVWLHRLQPLENQLSDWMVRQQAENLVPDPDIVLVNIDDASLARLQDVAGRWPWPRSVHGELVQGLSKQNPKAIVFDMTFEQPDVYRPESDRLFNQALEGTRNVYFPIVRRPKVQDASGPPVAQIASLVGLQPTAQADPSAHIALSGPLAIEPRFWRTGTINFTEDKDGVGRRYALYTEAYGWLIPSLPARVATDLGYTVPKQRDIRLAWRGKKHAFPVISYADLYEDFSREKPLRAPHEFTGKIVIIGSDASGLHDLRMTPIDSVYPGQEILAMALDNLKNQRMLTAAPAWLAPLATLLLLLLLFLAFARGWNALKIGMVLLVMTALAFGMSYFALMELQLLPVLVPLLFAWAYYFACALQGYLRERQAREKTMQEFSRFVNPHVVRELLARGGSLSRSGESRHISVLFSDIRGFTSLSENRTPQQVVELLNRYFTLQVEVVFRHGGSLDKFIGDCIMAFWGAPLDDKRHAQRAVAAALEMAEVLQRFKQELGEDQADFDVGIGIHSGAAVVGLIGSEQRREYTAIGDTVNLASRIEGLTKGLSRILVSHETMTLCGQEFEFAAFGEHQVKGREQAVKLFAPSRRSTA